MVSFLKIGQGADELCQFNYGGFYLNIRQNYRKKLGHIGNSKSDLVNFWVEPLANIWIAIFYNM